MRALVSWVKLAPVPVRAALWMESEKSSELKLVAAEALGDGEFVVVGALDALAQAVMVRRGIALAEIGGSGVKALGGAQVGSAGGVAVLQDRVLAGMSADGGKGTVGWWRAPCTEPSGFRRRS